MMSCNKNQINTNTAKTSAGGHFGKKKEIRHLKYTVLRDHLSASFQLPPHTN